MIPLLIHLKVGIMNNVHVFHIARRFKMKKLINTALAYLIAGAAAGVFFREFTKFSNFDGPTTLGLIFPACWCSALRCS